METHQNVIVNRLSFAYRTLLAFAASMVVWQSATANAQTASAEANFNQICAACHTVGRGIRIGPDLSGVTNIRSDDWLRRFIKSSQTMVKSGDPVADSLFRQFNIVMPDIPYSDAEIRGIIALLKSGWTTPLAPVVAEAPPTADQIRTGSELFQGTRRLANGGPACSSCHHVSNEAVIGGGVLAKSLTQAFGRLGAAGIQAILNAPPFPVMEQAYKLRPLSDNEKTALIGYLRNANANPPSYNQPREDGLKLFFGGLGGLGVLLGLYAVTWRRRKRYPVSRAIFDRQVHSR